MRDIQRLMGCLLFSDREPEDTPYADLLSPTRWDEVAQEFARQACSLMGQVRLLLLAWCGSGGLKPTQRFRVLRFGVVLAHVCQQATGVTRLKAGGESEGGHSMCRPAADHLLR